MSTLGTEKHGSEPLLDPEWTLEENRCPCTVDACYSHTEYVRAEASQLAYKLRRRVPGGAVVS